MNRAKKIKMEDMLKINVPNLFSKDTAKLV